MLALEDDMGAVVGEGGRGGDGARGAGGRWRERRAGLMSSLEVGVGVVVGVVVGTGAVGTGAGCVRVIGASRDAQLLVDDG